MIRRRTVLGAAALAPIAASAFGSTAFAATSQTLAVDLENRSNSSRVFAYVVGLEPGTNRWMFLRSDGSTKYYPPSPNAPGAPLGADCAIALSGPGGTRRITVPRINSCRVYFSLDRELTFLINPGPGIALPSAANPSDPNNDIAWSFCEFTFNDVQLYANITYVDFVGIPIGLRLQTPSGTQTAPGIPSGGLAATADRLRAQSAVDGSDWARLIRTGSNGRLLRALSPALGGEDLFRGYLESYVDETWQRYTGTDLVINTQFVWGVQRGRVQNGLLTFPGVGTFAKPGTFAIWNCSRPPFTTQNDLMGNLSARLAAAFNRTTIRDNPNQPDADGGTFYRTPRTNHYARIVHELAADGRGYAFPYDDVNGGSGDWEGKVQSGQPGVFTLTVGSP